ncbi:MAG: hypothetical protein R3E01_21145 [Pirellulaceae bacterium]|nr:hypothetical protein [Planctomycetales bacterium]
MNRCQVYYTRGSIPFLGTSIVGFVAGILLPFAALAVENAATNSDDSTTLPPGIVDTQNPNDASLSVAESLARIKVPDGFRVTLFAGEPDIRRPIAMSMDDRGRLWVVENYSHPNWQPTGQDRVVILEDQDGDGQFDRRKVFWDRGNYLTGIAWGHGGIWLCNCPDLIFLPDRDYDDVPDGEPEVVLAGWQRQNPNNVLNNLNWGPDGWLYGCVGESQLTEVEVVGVARPDRISISRGIWRYHPQSRRLEVVARGAVNPWGLDFNAQGEGFFTNCVLPHAWHLIPGAYYERRAGEGDFPHIYQRIGPICDHLHWGGGDWTSSRGGKGIHSAAGGGHAHTGAMIYQGRQWPEQYRHTLLMGNLHGNRLNQDVLVRNGSGYVAKHGEDFLFANDDWFRSLWQRQAPDGSVYVCDWHDFGECHDSDGSHRSSGRIYRVSFTAAERQLAPFDLQKCELQELVAWQRSDNEWFARQSRRVLHERATQGEDMAPAREALKALLGGDLPDTIQLRALWSLSAMGEIRSSQLLELLQSSNHEHVRAWTVRLLLDGPILKGVDSSVREALQAAALSDPSPLVRLHLASGLQRLSFDQRWPIARALATHAEDADDANLPPLIWYGILPLVADEPVEALTFAQASRIPILRQNIARRLASE